MKLVLWINYVILSVNNGVIHQAHHLLTMLLLSLPYGTNTRSATLLVRFFYFVVMSIAFYLILSSLARQMSSTSGYPSLTDPVPGNPSSFFTNFPHRPCVASTIRIPQQTKSQDIPAVAPENHQRKKETWSTPILKTTTAEGSISSTSTSSTGLFPHSSTPVEPPVRYLSDSLSFMATKAAFVEESQVTGIKRDYQVIKAINVSTPYSFSHLTSVDSDSLEHFCCWYQTNS